MNISLLFRKKTPALNRRREIVEPAKAAKASGVVREAWWLALVAIGFSVIIKGLARIPFGADVYTLPPALPDAAPFRFAGAIVTSQSALTIAISVGITLLLLAIFRPLGG